MIYILLGLVAVIAVFCIVVITRPDEFRVSRSAVIDGSPEAVFAEINDLYRWQAWSPWAKLDPNAKNTFEGPEAGVGAKMHWDGNKNIGAGSMAITESDPYSRIVFALNFIRPFKASNTVEFSLEPVDGKTRVTWTMYGKNNFIGKTISLFMDCEKMCGDQFIQGLSNLNEVVSSKTVS